MLTSFLCVNNGLMVYRNQSLLKWEVGTNKAFSSHLFHSCLLPTLQSFSFAPVSFFAPPPPAMLPSPISPFSSYTSFFCAFHNTSLFYSPFFATPAMSPLSPSILLCTSPLISPVSPYIQNNKLKYFSSSFCFF